MAAASRWTKWITSAALFAPLVLLLVASVRTWRAEQRYAAVTHRVLNDYAAIAAWQYARKANTVLHDETMRAFSGIAKGHQRAEASVPLQSPEAIIAARPTASSPILEHARLAFTYDTRSARIETAGGEADGATRAVLQRRLLEVARTTRPDDEPHRVLFDSVDGTPYAIVLWVITAHDQPASAMYGVLSHAKSLEEPFTRVIRVADLLPAARLTQPIDKSDIAVRLTRKDGGVVFASDRTPKATAATDTATLQSGELRTTVDLSPRLASALLVGGAPASQLPSLALMVALAAVLAVVGLIHERRNRELARLRGRFVANVSHELRTPLAQISMFAETLALGRERNPEEGRRFASIIFAEARRLTGLVESVLRFSRLESQHETLHVEVVSVSGEVASAIEIFTPVARASDVSITTELDHDVDAHIDRAAFRQILLNLLDNAVKHGGRGTSIHVSVYRIEGEALIIIDDSGPGVPDEWREKVFEPFVRAEKSKVAGAGIGLSVVRDLVTAHGGRVWIERSPRGGARSIVSVPALPASSQADHISRGEPVEAKV